MPKGFLYHLIDYQEPVDWTGLQIREDKAWSICEDAKPIMQCLANSPAHWVYLCTNFESCFKGLAESIHSLERACQMFHGSADNLAAGTKLFT